MYILNIPRVIKNDNIITQTVYIKNYHRRIGFIKKKKNLLFIETSNEERFPIACN